MGSIELLYSTNYNIKHFQCLSADIASLKNTTLMKATFGDFAAGSDCTVLDTSTVYVYHANSDSWIALSNTAK